MSEFEQIPFGSGEFADNPEPRCPCVTFGPVQLVNGFQTPDQFQPPVLDGAGDTPMGAPTDEWRPASARKCP